jgi:hypothetical protein
MSVEVSAVSSWFTADSGLQPEAVVLALVAPKANFREACHWFG